MLPERNSPKPDRALSPGRPSNRWFRWLIVLQSAVIISAVALLLVDPREPTRVRASLPFLALSLVPVVVVVAWIFLRQQHRQRAGTSPAVHSHGQPENQTAAKIAAVIADKALTTAFQPIRVLPSREVVGAEALTRFTGPPHIAPQAWFVEAESVGLGTDLEFLAMETALTAAKSLPAHLYVAVNVSPAACLDPRLGTVLTGSGLPRARIMLEVTERHEVEDYAPLAAALRPLREAGARIAVDDAGAGFASMRHILQLTPDLVKLDRYIVSGIDTDPGQRALAVAMTGFAREIGASLIAEGIETPAELETLAALGINTGQGYLLGRPSTQPEDWQRWTGGEFHNGGKFNNEGPSCSEK